MEKPKIYAGDFNMGVRERGKIEGYNQAIDDCTLYLAKLQAEWRERVAVDYLAKLIDEHLGDSYKSNYLAQIISLKLREVVHNYLEGK